MGVILSGYPRVVVDGPARGGVVSDVGATLLTGTVEKLGIIGALNLGLARFDDRDGFDHDLGKILTDLAVMVALGGVCPADLARLRCQPGIFGPVASDSTVSRMVDQLSRNIDDIEEAFDKVMSEVRTRVWNHNATKKKRVVASVSNPVVIDIDCSLVNVHSEKEGAAPTYKRGFGFHPVITAVDHPHFGEVTGIHLRPGNAGANTATDLVAAIDHAISTLPKEVQDNPGHILVRSDSAGFTHTLIDHLEGLGVQYSISRPMLGWALSFLDVFPDRYKENALNTHGDPRDDTLVIEVQNTHDFLKGSTWPENMRVIYRTEPLHPGASNKWVDAAGRRVTAIATNTPHAPGTHAQHLDVRHRKRARMEQTIARLKDTGLTRLPYQSYANNRVWVLIVQLASLLLNWVADLVLEGKPRRWMPKSMRYRLFHIAGTITRHAHKTRYHIANHPWTGVITRALDRLRRLRIP